MRAALVVGLALALAALLAVERRSAAVGRAPELPVRVFSRGETHFPRVWSEQALFGEISIGDSNLFGPARDAGLRVATISPARELIGFENFDVAGAPQSLARLVAQADDAPDETAWVVCVQGAIQPPEQRERALLAQLFEMLDASVPPLETPSASWALVSVKRSGRWIAAAESRGDTAPTRLSFLLRPAGFDYERREPRVRRDTHADEPALGGLGSEAARYELVSVADDGAGSTDRSGAPSLSADARFVAFVSTASNLVPGDRNECEDIFVRDRSARSTTRASVGLDGREADGASFDPSISDDGRWIAFQSRATNLVAGDRNDASDVFVRDRGEGSTLRVSSTSSGVSGDGESAAPRIAGGAGLCVFASGASDLVAHDTNRSSDVFLFDLAHQTLERVSLDPRGGELDGDSRWPAISGDGRFVAFASRAGNSSANAPDGLWSVYVRERSSGAVELVSPSSTVAGVGDSTRPALSDDGRWLVFESAGAFESAPSASPEHSIFVHDRVAGRTLRIATPWDGPNIPGDSRQPAISGDGTTVAFMRYFERDLAGTDDPLAHVYRWKSNGAVELVDALPDGNPAEPGHFHHTATRPSLSRDGCEVAFATASDALVPLDRNRALDVVVRSFCQRR